MKRAWLLLPALLSVGPSLWAGMKSGAKFAGPGGGGTEQSTRTITCDFLEYRSSENVVLAHGHVVMTSSSTRLEADEVTIHTADKSAFAQGHVHLHDGAVSLWADKADYSSQDSTATLYNA